MIGLDTIVEEFYGGLDITNVKKITLELRDGKVEIEWVEGEGWELVVE